MTSTTPRRALRRTILLLSAALAGGLTAGVVAVGAGAPRHRTADPLDVPVDRRITDASTDSTVRDRDIEFYRARVERDPSGATDLARLASLYLQRSRETGDQRDAERAEQAASRSVRNRRGHNDEAVQVLASSLLAQHRFDDALRVAKHVSARNPESAALRAAVAEIDMELGNYDSARVAFTSPLVRGASNDLAVIPRLARWAEIEGRTEDARRLMRRAIVLAAHHRWLPREQVAWFDLRAGDIEFRAGQLGAADSAYRAGLAANPGDYRVLAALSRLASHERRWSDAIDYGEQSLASNLDPATLGILSDAYAALGDSSRAEDYARALEASVRAQPGSYHRAWSLFLLDHDRAAATVHRKIREELATRRDVYGYDLRAWSLYKQGQIAGAQRAMTHALTQGTRDPLLYRHAGIIARAAGHDSVSHEYLSRARALDPSLR